MAELTAIGWVVSPMIKKMMEKIPSYITGRYRWDRDMKKDLEKLQRTLLQIQVVVDKARGWQWHTMEDSQKQLLRQLKDAVYEADDLLDEFEYQDMKAQAKVAEGSTVSRVMSSSVKFGKRLVGQDKLRINLTEILKKLEDVKESADFFVKLAGVERTSAVEQVEISSRRTTGAVLTKDKIFVGRNEEKNKVVSLLLKSTTDEPQSSDSSISIISIIGDGGMGKTTLAQIVYNDQTIKDQFPLRMWICVSDNFDEIKLTREILECASELDEKTESTMNFDKLQQNLRSKLESKRFLLILDDVWPDEKRGEHQNVKMWNQLLAPLQDGAKDSKILVTTRMKIVAESFGVTNLISLEGLTKDDMWSLLEKHAFANENADNHPDLKKIGKQIAEKLKGSPLACEVVGSMLRDRLDATKWKNILEREMVDDVISNLRLSYQYLPDHLKQCFAYCSIFPKNWHFNDDKLVLFWIAQDYIKISDKNDRPLVDVGMDYFEALLCRSFFQKVSQKFHTYYIIHDLMHDLAESVSMDECFRFDPEKQRKIMQPVRHLGVDINNKDEFKDFVAWLEKTSNLKNLRTLIFYRCFWEEPINLPLSIFEELKSVRVLDFGWAPWEGIIPESIGNLTHLRYLCHGNLTDCLPESLYKLYHLQVLATSVKLRFCESMTKLIKFGNLTRLVPRLEFRVDKKRGQSMGVLKDMAAVLRGPLWITDLKNVTGMEEALEADLKSMQHLEDLTLRWSSEPRNEWSHETDEVVAEALKPHSNLIDLWIDGFMGIKSPSWLERKWMINLQTIELFRCRCLEVLPPLGHLPSLKELRIGEMDAVKRVGSEFYGVVDDSHGVRGFPCLEELWFQGMPEWLEWCGADFPVFPRLRQLRVDYCPKLMRFPLFSSPTLRDIKISGTALISRMEMNMRPSSWEHLYMEMRLLESSSSSSNCFAMDSSILPSSALLHDNILAAIELLNIEDCTEPMPAGCFVKLAALRALTFNSCQESLAIDALPASLEYLRFYDCAGLTSLPSAQVLQHLIALQELVIVACEELTSLGALHCLPSLKVLSLNGCLELKLLSEERLPASIEMLELFESHPALMQQIREKNGPEWDKVAHIPELHFH